MNRHQKKKEKKKIHTLAPNSLLLLVTVALLPNGWSYFPPGNGEPDFSHGYHGNWASKA